MSTSIRFPECWAVPSTLFNEKEYHDIKRGCRMAAPFFYPSGSDQGKGGTEDLLDGGPVNREGVGTKF